MTKEAILEFFNEKAAGWDAMDETQPEIVNEILDNACISGNVSLLDVACGTGVLIPFYLERGVTDITAIDIAPEMIKIAKEKFSHTPVKFLTEDIDNMANVSFTDNNCEVNVTYDRIVMYNAFPHFPNPKKTIDILCEMLSPGGIFTIAHGKSREVIDAHHKGHASAVSRGLMSIEELAEMIPETVTEIKRVSDERMYQIVVRRRDK